MNWTSRLELGEIRRLNENVSLMKTDKALIEVNAGAILVSVGIDQVQRGYVLHGEGTLAVDVIVETADGAVGKPIQKILNEPFLALMSTFLVEERLTVPFDQDLKAFGYVNEEAFRTRADDLCRMFFGISDNHFSNRGDGGFVFVFPRKNGRPDLLVADHDRLVFKSREIVFISNGHKAILKSSEGFLVAGCSECLLLGENKHVHRFLGI